jgi:BMFP domain-containing protein YqiC
MMEKEAAAREVAKVIQEFRAEVQQKFRDEFEADMKKMDEEGFDPTRGRGRGPKWADGA